MVMIFTCRTPSRYHFTGVDPVAAFRPLDKPD